MTSLQEKSQSQTVERYDSWHQRLSDVELTGEVLGRPWYQTVSKLLPDLSGCSVLEIGCGRGDFSIWLASQFGTADITGVDFSPAAIAIARERADVAHSKARFAVADAQDLAFNTAEFDYVISCECLEHVQNPLQMAAEIQRVLRPAGQFILTTENYFNGMILAWLMKWIFRIPFDSGSGVQPHENFFLYWRVKRLLEKAGLAVTHMESNHFQWLLLPGTDPGKLVTFDFDNRVFKRIARPFGRHYTFTGHCRSK
jgi:ubiquinone/menaquinone biosynthesis C-methylase UbiE